MPPQSITLFEMKIRCYIKPNARHDEGVEQNDDGYIVRVKAPAIDGKANEAARHVLAHHFAVSPSQVQLISGHTSRYKTFEIL